MHMYILVVDDEVDRFVAFEHNNPDHVFRFVSTPDEAIEALSKNNYDFICLDHDLGFFPDTNLEMNTMPIVDWMRKEWSYGNWNDNTTILVHSLNVPARAVMIMTLQRIQCHVMAIPFAWSRPKLFDCLKGNDEHL